MSEPVGDPRELSRRAFWSRIVRRIDEAADELHRFRNALLALMAAYVFGLLSLSAWQTFRDLPRQQALQAETIARMDTTHMSVMRQIDSTGVARDAVQDALLEGNQQTLQFLLCARRVDERECINRILLPGPSGDP